MESGMLEPEKCQGEGELLLKGPDKILNMLKSLSRNLEGQLYSA